MSKKTAPPLVVDHPISDLIAQSGKATQIRVIMDILVKYSGYELPEDKSKYWQGLVDCIGDILTKGIEADNQLAEYYKVKTDA